MSLSLAICYLTFPEDKQETCKNEDSIMCVGLVDETNKTVINTISFLEWVSTVK